MRLPKIIMLAMIVTLIQNCSTKTDKITIYTIGDSTMADKKPDVYPETGWCQVLNSFLDESVTISNHAVNGRSTKSFINENRWQVVLDSLKRGDFVFIQFGHNDEKEYDSSRYTTPFGTFSENLKRFVSDARGKGATPVLFTSIVRRKFDENGKLIKTHGDYPDATRQVAKDMNVYLIDLEKLTEDWINSVGDEPSKEFFLWTAPNEKFPAGRKDDTHLSDKGAREVARLAYIHLTHYQKDTFAK
jgi:lysophospholipase L1-like esterase